MSEENHSGEEVLLGDLLRVVLAQYADEVPSPLWLNEHYRWLELLVCLLFACGGQGGQRARRTVSLLDELGLLEVPSLAKLGEAAEERGLEDGQLALMRQILQRVGLADDDAAEFLQLITGLAQDVMKRHQGRIQLYLRRHGERMLADLRADFPSLPASDGHIRRAFVIWLQNALTLPVFLDNASSRRFCEAVGCTMEELYQAADELDINAALLDDIMDLWAVDEEMWHS
jgi:hypothetical protein